MGPFNSFNDFFVKLTDITKEITKDDNLLLLYRGQKNSSWDLLPKIARKEYNFIGPDFLTKEKDLVEEFQRLSRPYTNSDLLTNAWDLLSLAQHHGLPTRLLDWTTNPLVALYFAFKEKDTKVKTRTVWLLKIDKSELADCNKNTPFNNPKTVAFKPNHVTQRLISQNGWFTTHKFINTSKRFITPSNTFIKLNKNKAYKDRIFKFQIINNAREEILTRLDTFGINELTLFPGIDGLSKYLEWKKN
jgi:hypothetical protein